MLSALISCVIMLDPTGFAGRSPDLDPVSIEIEHWWDINTSSGVLRANTVLSRDGEGAVTSRRLIVYGEDEWMGLVCDGCDYSQYDECF